MSPGQVTPEVLWAQRSSDSDPEKNYVYLTISVPDVPPKALQLQLSPTGLVFTGTSDTKKTTYHLELEFYAEIDPEKSKTHHTAANIQLILHKKDLTLDYWPRLLKGDKKVHFLRTDFDKWVDEDEQNEAPEEDYLNQFGGGLGDDSGFGGIDFSKLGAGVGGGDAAAPGAGEATAEHARGHDGTQQLSYTFLAPRLEASTVSLAEGHEAVCLFVNDDAGAEVLEHLAQLGVKVVALRCAGTNNVDLNKAEALCLKVTSVPSYSPHAVAEFTVGLLLTATRKYHKAYNRTREGDFTLNGLVGFNLYEKTIGLIGTGRIGLLTGRILARGMGCNVIAYDPYPNPKAAAEHGVVYVDSLDKLLKESDVVSLHCPLMQSTHHILNDETFALMKRGVVLVNSSRGGLIDTKALIRGHQAFLTVEALQNIATSSIEGIIEKTSQ
ncbi:hypothetical protein DV737_g541, partial [Chaetothyriales sp. CBS 132003]